MLREGSITRTVSWALGNPGRGPTPHYPPICLMPFCSVLASSGLGKQKSTLQQAVQLCKGVIVFSLSLSLSSPFSLSSLSLPSPSSVSPLSLPSPFSLSSLSPSPFLSLSSPPQPSPPRIFLSLPSPASPPAPGRARPAPAAMAPPGGHLGVCSASRRVTLRGARGDTEGQEGTRGETHRDTGRDAEHHGSWLSAINVTAVAASCVQHGHSPTVGTVASSSSLSPPYAMGSSGRWRFTQVIFTAFSCG